METAEMRRSTLQRKDRDELTHIAETLGRKPPSRARKGEIIEMILDLVSDGNGAADPDAASAAGTDGAHPQAASAGQDAPTEQDLSDAGSRRRRRRGRERENSEDPGEDFGGEAIQVQGHLDLRSEGYGFLRVDGFLAGRDDCYVPVKLVRRHGLRKGDAVVGLARPAGRSEKNPALLSITSVNGADPNAAAGRPGFDELTPVFPSERLALEPAPGPLPDDGLTARVIDLVTPLGKGQRALIVSPPRAGKTTVVKQIVRCLEANRPEMHLLVLLIDSRPEDVTEMRRWTERAEVLASTFERPAEEHITLAEMTIERAKRMAESGADVCVILDSLSRLSRACAAEGAPAGRARGSAVAAAIQPARRLFAAGRNTEEAGSVTVLATLHVNTGSPTDEMIAEEFGDTATAQLRLDAQAAARRVFPAIDLAGSYTLHEELLLTPEHLDRLRRFRGLLDAAFDDSSPVAGLEMLIEHLDTVPTNDEFLAEVVSSATDS